MFVCVIVIVLMFEHTKNKPRFGQYMQENKEEKKK